MVCGMCDSSLGNMSLEALHLITLSTMRIFILFSLGRGGGIQMSEHSQKIRNDATVNGHGFHMLVKNIYINVKQVNKS